MQNCNFVGGEEKKLKGVPVIYADKPGRNRNLYPKEELLKAIDYYKKLVTVDPTYKYMFIKHPKDQDEEWLGLVAGAIDDIYFDENENLVRMDCTLLPNAWGQFIAWLLEHDYVVGTSIRGDADKAPSVYNLNGKQIDILIRTDLKLEGVDFVVYPSFITTHATKDNVSEKVDNFVAPIDVQEFERVLESFSKDIGIDLQEIIGQEEVQMDKDKGMKANELSPEQLEKLKLELEIFQMKHDKIKEQVSQLQEKEKVLQDEIAKLDTQKAEVKESVDREVSVLTKIKEEHQKISEQLSKAKAEFDEVLKALEEKKAELSRVEEALKRKHKAAVVNCCGKTFDDNNKPKIRVVPIEEQVSDSPWGEVDKDVVRKLVWLTGDKELANKVFGVVEDWNGWTSFKYPVYQPLKSETEGYDVDFVLNRYGLAKALGYMLGRGSVGLTREQKKHLVQFLYDKYAELQKQGLAEIPASLEKLAKRMKVVEKVEFTEDSDEFLSAVVESALLHGIVDIEGIEQLAEDESIEIKASPEVVGDVVAKFLLAGEDSVTEQADKPKVPSKDQIIAMLIQDKDGNPTEFAKKYDLTSPDELSKLFDDIDENDADLLGKFKDALYTYLRTVLETPEDAIAVIEPMFALFEEYISKSAEGGAEAEVENKSGEGNEGGNEGNEGGETAPVAEKTASATDNEDGKQEDGYYEYNPAQNTDKVEEDEKVFEQVKELLESHFEGVSVESSEDAIELVKKLIQDYTDAYTQLQRVEFESIRESKVRELTELGVDQKIIDEELADIEDVETLETTVEKIKSIFSKVKEQKQAGAIDPLALRKSKQTIEEDNKVTDSLFDKMMRIV